MKFLKWCYGLVVIGAGVFFGIYVFAFAYICSVIDDVRR